MLTKLTELDNISIPFKIPTPYLEKTVLNLLKTKEPLGLSGCCWRMCLYVENAIYLLMMALNISNSVIHMEKTRTTKFTARNSNCYNFIHVSLLYSFSKMEMKKTSRTFFVGIFKLLQLCFRSVLWKLLIAKIISSYTK